MDLREPILAFFRAQFSGAPDHEYVSLFIDGGCHFAPISNLEKAVDLVLAKRESANVYYGVATREKDLGPYSRGGKADCASVGSLWLDIDIGTVGHKAQDLPPDIQSVVPLLLELGIRPSLVVATGGGCHAYFRLDKPFTLGTKESIARFEKLNRAINNRFATLCAAKGWAADSQTANVDRILRVPHTFNLKDGLRRDVLLVDDNATTHTFEGLEAAFPSTSAPAPTPKAALEILTERLGIIKKPGLVRIAQRVLKGESIADGGDRDATLQKICATIATIDPETDPETLAEVLRPSLTVWANEPSATLTVDEELAKAIDKIARSQAYGKERAAEARAVEALQMRAARKHSDREGPYTDDELRQFAVDQNCTVEQFARRWVIQKRAAFWVWVDGKYIGPRLKEELDCALPIDLSPAQLQWYTLTEKGTKPRTAKEMAALHGTVANRLVADLTIDKSYFDPNSETFYEAVCPRRNLEPEFNGQVDAWLRLLGGPEANKLLDWLATVSDLSRQTCAVYLSGAPGAGKGMFAKGVARIWNEGAPTKLANILNGFNLDLTRCPVVFADEKLPNKPGISSDLREIIGTESQTLTRKFMDNAELRGAVRIIIAGNNDHLLAVDKEEELTPDDLAAIAGRFLHIEVTDQATAYLKAIGGVSTGTKGWVDEDIIAKHVLWLHANREVKAGDRFLVEGHMSKMHELLATAGKWPSLVCEWVVRFIMKPDPGVLVSAGVLVGRGEVLVNTTSIVDHWDQYIKSSQRPSIQLVGRAIGNMATTTVRKDGARYHVLDAERLLRWADRSQIGDPDALRAKVNGPPVTRALTSVPTIDKV